MKEHPLDGHRGKVAVAPEVGGTNFVDDDYNEWELGIGDLIIDLDADIEKTNEKIGGQQQQQPQPQQQPASQQPTPQNGVSPGSALNFQTAMSKRGVEHQATVDKGLKMKIKRKNVGGKASETKHEIVQSDTNNTKSSNATPQPVGVTLRDSTSGGSSGGANAGNTPPNSGNTSSSSSSSGGDSKSKHSSSKGRSSGHREKKEKNRDKASSSSSSSSSSSTSSNKASCATATNVNNTSAFNSTNNNSVTTTTEINGTAIGSSPPSLNKLNSSSSSSSSLPSNFLLSSTAPPTSTTLSNCSSAASDSIIASTSPTTGQAGTNSPSVVLRLDTKYCSPTSNLVLSGGEDVPSSPPQPKRSKIEMVDSASSPQPVEVKDAMTDTSSVGTITEPDCLGPCEPGTSVTLEGIVWQETQGGVLVVNVTWRGKTYVGTLLDCTKHDWAPPRFCESPTSDVDAKNAKGGRGKRGGRSTQPEAAAPFTENNRNVVQSKLRNGKGRRGCTVPSSPAKTENCNKRKGSRLSEEPATAPSNEKGTGPTPSKRSRTQTTRTSTSTSTTPSANNSTSPSSTPSSDPSPTSTSVTVTTSTSSSTSCSSTSSSSSSSTVICNNNNNTTTTTTMTTTNNTSSGSSNPSNNNNNNNNPPPSDFPQPPSPVFIECPEPNCNKKYKHINGLKYHQTHAHSANEEHHQQSAVACIKTEENDEGKEVPVSSENEESLPEEPPINSSAPSSPGGGGNFANSSDWPPQQPGVREPMEEDSFNMTSNLSTLAMAALGTNSSETNSATSLSSTVVAPSSALRMPNVAGANLTPNSFQESLLRGGGDPYSPNHHGANSQTLVSSVGLSSSPSQANLSSPGLNLDRCPTNLFTPLTTNLGLNQLPSSEKPPKIKQEKPDKQQQQQQQQQQPMSGKSSSKSSSLLAPTNLSSSSSSVRPIIPAPPALGQQGHNTPTSPAHHSSLKPIQPKPTILGEPSIISPALESLKRDKSKHKKKSKDKDKKGEGKSHPSHSSHSLVPMDEPPLVKLEGGHAGYHDLSMSDCMPVISSQQQTQSHSLKPLNLESTPPLELTSSSASHLMDNSTINDNVQSPAYSDISDANEPSPMDTDFQDKDKEDKKAELTPSQSTLSALGMISYYSQPPFLIPSVSADKPEKPVIEKPWNEMESSAAVVTATAKKSSSMDEISNPPNIPGAPPGLREYTPPYPYSFSYMQGYPFSGMDSPYHLHLLSSDPQYKVQYEQHCATEEQERLYKSQLERHHHVGKSSGNNSSNNHNNSGSGHHHHHHSSLKEDKLSSSSAKEKSSSSSADHGPSVVNNKQTVSVIKEHDSIHGSSRNELKIKKEKSSLESLSSSKELSSSSSSNKSNKHYDMSRLLERHHSDDMRRFYMFPDQIMDYSSSDHGLNKSSDMKPPPELLRNPLRVSSPKVEHSGKMFSGSGSLSSPKIGGGSHKEHSFNKESLSSHGSSKKDREHSSSNKHDLLDLKEDKKADKPIKSEGQKPTMETTGPPPPPTNSYSYLAPPYLQSAQPHFGHVPYDHGHPVYRNSLNPMMMSGPHFGGGPFMHPQLRYHVPHELSAAPPPGPPQDSKHHGNSQTPSSKTLDMLSHYTSSSHKIHELQEHALLSPSNKPSTPVSSSQGSSSSNKMALVASSPIVSEGKNSKNDANSSVISDHSRSPPPQRHLHTHHHTHVGVGYPIYDPYGAMMATQQAAVAAASVINPYKSK